MRKNLYVFTLLASFLGFAQMPPLEEIPMDSKVKVGELDNGLTYYIKENSEPKQRAQLYLVTKVGSMQETDDQLGLAHFLEHMAFNGTERFPKNDLIDYLQKAGIQFGADLNAYTSFEETVYQLPMPTDDAELFESGFEILSQWAGAITLDHQEIDNERGVILEEDRQRIKNANGRMSKQLIPVLFSNSRYMDRLPIGDPDIISNFKYEELEEFYQDWYRPDLQGVIAVGDFDSEQVEAYIKEYFSSLSSGQDKPALETYEIPGNQEPRVAVITDPEYPYTVVSVMYKHPRTITKTTHDFRNSIMGSAINSMLGARIGEIIEKGDAPFLNADASYGAFQGGVGNLNAFSLQVIAQSPSEVQQGVDGLMDIVISMRDHGFTQSELDRVKSTFFNAVERSYLEMDKTSSRAYVNQLVQHFTKGEAVIDMEYSMKFYQEYLEGISLEEVNEMARSFVTEENQIVLLQASEDSIEQLPSKENLVEWVNTERTTEAYLDDFVDGPLISEELDFVGIAESDRNDHLGATEVVLENGVRIILKETDFKNNEILFTAFSPGGYSLADEEIIKSAKIAASITASSGLGDFKASQINKMLTGKSLSVSPFIGTYSEGFRGSSTPEDMETALEVLYLYATQPRKDTTTFNTMKRNYRVSLEGKSSNPMAVFQDTVNLMMRGHSPWAADLELEDIDQLSLDTAHRFYKDRFADASDFTFVFVGSFEEDSLLPKLQKYLGSLPVINRKEDYKDVGIKPLPGKVDKTVYKGMEDKAVAILTYHDDFDFSLENRLYLRAIKSTLELRMLERLREQESGVYSPSVSMSVVKRPSPYYSLSVSFTSATSRVDQLIEAAVEEIENMKEDGPTKEELEKFVAQEKRNRETGLRTNRFWLSHLKSVYEGRIDGQYLQAYEKALDGLKPRKVRKAAGKFLSSDGISRLILLPETTD